MAHSPFPAAFTDGTRFAQERGGPIRMTTHVTGDLICPTGRLHTSDPFVTSFDEPEPPLQRTAPTGKFPVELAVAHFENDDARVACARVRFATSPAVRWELALFEGQLPPGPDAIAGYGVDAGMGCFFDDKAKAPYDEAVIEGWLKATQERSVNTWTWHVAPYGNANVVMFSSGWGDGFYGSYWGLDAGGAIVELVSDFDVLVGPMSERIELPLPLASGRVIHPLLKQHQVEVRRAFFSSRKAIVSGRGTARIELSDESPVKMTRKAASRQYTWDPPAPGVRLVISVMVGMKALDVL